MLLNPARRSGEIQNRGSRNALLEAGIDVLDTNPAFAVTHEKSMVIDDNTAFIGSLNWDPGNRRGARFRGGDQRWGRGGGGGRVL